MLNCIVMIEANQGMRNALVELINKCALESRKEEGCILYDLYISVDDDCNAVLIEKWKDNDALQSHFQTEHYKELIERSKDMRSKPDSVQVFEE